MKKGPASVRASCPYSDLSADAWEKLDRFEGDRYAREKVTVALTTVRLLRVGLAYIRP